VIDDDTVVVPFSQERLSSEAFAERCIQTPRVA
jgi:hypothetical protein